MRRVVELHWRALLAGSACAGLAASNFVTVAEIVLVLAALVALAAVAVLSGGARVVAVGAVLVLAGLWWGGLRLEAMGESVLVAKIGESAPAELVVTGPAHKTMWSVRVLAEVRRFREQRLRERVLLMLPVGRSPPRGTVLETAARVMEPRSADEGFDERAWLARQGIHVVLRGGAWQRSGGVVALPESVIAFATVSSVLSAAALSVCDVLSSSASCSEKTRGSPIAFATTSGPLGCTTSSPSLARTSPSSQSGSSGWVGCCDSRARRASSQRSRGSECTCSPSAGSRR